eukprot:TRINITY_DN17400_c0_g1_i1.p1 TRINITY_DN17400_c0_g1~~TRINITY_DN17400_c0_g1_i1.p1  ORF type:complete len:744 (+),score=86.44 TRINITY_DN17400_c0_g1_i1:89-2320(+)
MKKCLWSPFLRRVGERPEAFYERCADLLQAQDLYEPDHLLQVDGRRFDRLLSKNGATVGMRLFLAQALCLAKTGRISSIPLELKRPDELPSTLHIMAIDDKHATVGMSKADHARLAIQSVASPKSSAKSWFSIGYGWDARAFALHRFLMGMVMLKEVIYYASHFESWLSDSGFTPRLAVVKIHESFGSRADLLNVYLSCGGYGLLIILFAHGLVACHLIVGRGGRLTYALGLMFATALHQRVAVVAYGGMRVQRAMLFWGMFRPEGEAEAAEKKSAATTWLLTLAQHAAVLQLCYVYGVTGLAKTDPEHWQTDGQAVQWLLHLGCYVRPSFLVDLLKDKTDFLRWLTLSTMKMEVYMVFLLWIPSPIIRALCLLALSGFHVGILLTTKITEFSFIMFAAIAFLLPAPAIDMLLPFIVLPCRLWHRRFGDRVQQMRALFGVAVSATNGQTGAVRPGKPLVKEMFSVLSIVALVTMVVFYAMGTAHTHSSLLTEFGWRAEKYICPSPVLGTLQFFGMLHWFFMFAPRVTSETWLQAYAKTTSGKLYDMAVDGVPQRYRETTLEDAVLIWPRPYGNQRWLAWTDNNFKAANNQTGFRPVTEFYKPAFFRNLCATPMPRGDRIAGIMISRFRYNSPMANLTLENFPSEYYWYHWCHGDHMQIVKEMVMTFEMQWAKKHQLLEKIRPHYPYRAPRRPWWHSIAITSEDWVDVILWAPCLFAGLCLGATAVVEEYDKQTTSSTAKAKAE